MSTEDTKTEPPQEVYLKPEELAEQKITKDDLSLLNSVRNFMNKKSKGGKSRTAKKSDNKKSANYTLMNRIILGVDKSNEKLSSLEGDKLATETKANRQSLRDSMASLSKLESWDYNTVKKVFSSAGKALLDLPKPEVKKKASEASEKQPETPPATN